MMVSEEQKERIAAALERANSVDLDKAAEAT
jgi:hypothetical protein